MQGHQAVGYELNPWLVLYSRWRAYRSGVYGSAKFYCKNLWKVGAVLIIWKFKRR